MESVLQDLRYAMRGFRREPASFLIAVIAMALGIGGTTAVFSVVDRMLFRPLHYAGAERIVWFGVKAPINTNEFLLEGAYVHFRDHQKVFEAMTSFSGVGDCDLNEAQPERLRCAQAAADFLPFFGITPLLGRNFTQEETTRNGPKAVLLTYGFWQRRFGRDESVVGRKIQVDGRPVLVAGVLPESFEMPNLARPDMLMGQQVNLAPHVSFTFLTAFGRLKPGISAQQAYASLYPLFQDTMKDVPAGFAKECTFHVTPLRDRQVKDYRTASVVLLGCVIGLLLISCANVANLLLARAAARRREISIRMALGAGRVRLMCQMLTESLLLAMCGCTAGLMAGAALLRALVNFAPAGIPRVAGASLDGRVLLFAVLISVCCGLLFGMAPALQLPRPETLNTTRVKGDGLRLRQSLIALQIALSFTLLTGAGLLLRSFWNLEHVQLGMRVENVLTVRVQLGRERYPQPAQQAAFLQSALARVQRLPGIRSVALSDSVPLYGSATTMIFSNILVEGRPLDPKRLTGGMTIFRTVSPAYFETLRIPILKGRAFTERDQTGAELVTILDEQLAKKLFPNEDPIGKQMRSPEPTSPPHTIIGVAARVKNGYLNTGDDPEYYYPWRQDTGRARAHLLLRSDGQPGALARLVTSEIDQLDPALPLTITTMDENIGRQIELPRFETMLLGLFALIGVALAAVGQFGVISCLVTQRSSELGVRMALGATPGNVIALVLRNTLTWTLSGAAAGFVAAFAGAKQLESMLFGVRARDVWTAAAVFLVLIAVSILAAWQPSRRASRLDPAQVLRHE